MVDSLSERINLLRSSSLCLLCEVYSAFYNCFMCVCLMCVMYVRLTHNNITNCRRAAATICPRPSPPPWVPKCLARASRRQRTSSFLRPTAAWRANTAVSKAVWWPWPWPFDLESGVRVACDVGYLCANFGLPGPLCSRLRHDVRDR